MSNWNTVVETFAQLFGPIGQLLKQAAYILPGIFIAFLVVLLGYIISKGVSELLRNILVKCNIDAWFEHTRRHKAIGGVPLSKVLSGIVKWYLLSLFLVGGFLFIPNDALGTILTAIAVLIPQFILSVLIFFVGLVLTDILCDKIAHLHALEFIKIANPVVRFFLTLLSMYAALIYLLPATPIIPSIIYNILITGAVIAISVAVGVSVAIALRTDIEKAVKKSKKHFGIK